MGKFPRVDGKKSSSYCSTITVVVVVSFCLVGAWVLMSTSVVPIQKLGLSSEETINKVKKTEVKSTQFEDNSDDNGETQNESESASRDEKIVESQDDTHEAEDHNKKNDTDETQENSVNEGSDENVETQAEQSAESENGDEKNEDGASNPNGNSNAEDTETNGETNNQQTEVEDKSEGNESTDNGESIPDKGESKASQTEDNIDGNNMEIQVKDKFSDDESVENASQNTAWSTQATESENQKELQQSSVSEQKYEWKVCNVTAGPDYIPCLDNWGAIKKLTGRNHYEHRERHCPDEGPTCLVALPDGYKRPIKWPQSRDKIWYHNVPHTKLADVKGHQNWVKVTGEYLTFPGGGTQFKNGALHYIDFLQKSHSDIAWGKRSRVIFDVGCGVASFGGYLFERDVLAMSMAPKDEHEAQVQFALERGIPAISGVMGTKRLPFPSSVFDAIHCARCRVPWHIEGGKLLLELNRLLRPGGYFIWSATPVYQKLPEDVGIWKEMSKLTKAMCWDLVTIQKDKLNAVAAAFYRKPTSNNCYNQRAKNEPPLCKKSDDPNAAWNVLLEACMHKVPVNASERGSRWPEQWPLRLEKPPYWLKSQTGVYGKAATDDFAADYAHWKHVVSKSYLSGMGIDWSSVRNVMDMRAVYGGFAAALKDLKLWVMNIVPTDSPDTLPVIYERGLFGMYHDWCESFNTYPRTYDILHADHLFSSLGQRCNLASVIAEVDRILRPEGKLIVRDNTETITEVENLTKSLKWEIRMTFSKDNEGLLCVQKTMWRPKKVETILSAIM